jgi:hypothetical protein
MKCIYFKFFISLNPSSISSKDFIESSPFISLKMYFLSSGFDLQIETIKLHIEHSVGHFFTASYSQQHLKL